MSEHGLSDRLQAPATELITVPARIEDNDNLPMVACEIDQPVLLGQSIIGGVNSVSLAALLISEVMHSTIATVLNITKKTELNIWAIKQILMLL